MVARGLKALLKKTAPGKLVRSKRGGAAYRPIDASTKKASGRPLRGVARLLGERLWSEGSLPVTSDARPGGAWRGADGGQKRGRAVDAQVSRLVNLGGSAMQRGASMRMTRMVFSALEQHGLEPVLAQRVVLDERRGIATAADVVCQRGDQLILVELKVGYAGCKTAPASKQGRACTLRAPCATAKDTVCNRHLSQLAATLALFRQEADTLRKLRALGIAGTDGALLYVSEDDGSLLVELADWWKRRGPRLLRLAAAR